MLIVILILEPQVSNINFNQLILNCLFFSYKMYCRTGGCNFSILTLYSATEHNYLPLIINKRFQIIKHVHIISLVL